MREELYINNSLIDLYDDTPVSLNYSIADIREPERRMSSYSKTITIPATANNNKIFGHIFELSKLTTSGDFNPNKKAPAILYIDSIPVIRGFVRMMKIKSDNGKTEYDIVLYESLTDLFTDIGDDLLNSLDYSDLDHVFNGTNIRDSWDLPSGAGRGVIYPLIDNAKNDLYKFKVPHFTPSIWFYDIVKKIELKYGYTFQSNFIESDYFKKLGLLLSAASEISAVELLARSFKYNVVSPTVVLAGIVAPTQVLGFTQAQTMFINDNVVEGNFPNVVYDARNVAEDTGAHTKFRPSKGGIYSLKVRANIEVENYLLPDQSPLFPPGKNTYRITAKLYSRLQNFPLVLEDEKSTYVTIDTLAVEYYNLSFFFENLYLQQGGGSKYFVVEIILTYAQQFNNQGGGSSCRLLDTSYMELTANQGAVKDGDVMDVVPYIYPDLKIRDFLKSVILMHNLYLTPDKNNDKIIHIEPATTFYNTSVIKDWSEKMARDKKIEIVPIGEITSKTFEYKYTKDEDYLNTFYLSQWDAEYGAKSVSIDNDFISKVTKNTLVFAPTLNSDRLNRGRAIPSLVERDGDFNYTTLAKYKPRIFIYGGLKPCDAFIVSGITSGDLTSPEYPFCCHIDSDESPTFDILFETPKELYWGTYTEISGTYTNNNLFNKYYSQFLEEITDKDSKVLTAYFFLKPSDIYDFSFSDKINIDGNLFRVNKIYDFNPVFSALTKVELLKIKGKITFEPSTVGVGVVPFSGEYGIIEGGEDEVRNVSATNDVYIIDGGLNEVRNIAATGDEFIIQG